ncbi:uncharacterized protein LOC121400039 [Xenopus laevis]|uniref:Uncharacterized protein LOC121400039 n=1 Tax=Xenopus laevis TaxID=8355 RepID=A0A8J1MBE1_XENLA|nr:uncharacterized protein LOC121400039 [Xenopus laevis]
MAAVCAQESGGSFRPVAYFSKVMPLPVQGMPACLRALAASAMAVELSQSVTIGHNTILHTSHQVTHLLKNITTQHMTSQRLSGYEVILLGTANLQIKYAINTQGPAAILHALLHLSDPTNAFILDPHDCVESIHYSTSPRLDLTDTPLSHATNVFVDGSCSRPSDDTYKAAYSVVQLPDIVLETKSIPVNSAQAAELIALTRACHLFANRPVNIFSDSRYAFGVVHDFGKIWQQRGYVTTDGKSIAHPALIDNLLQAIQLPSEIAIIHCRAHTNRTDEISLGNALADQVAKTTASSATPTVIPMFLHTPTSCPDSQILQYLQTFATQTDLHFWEQQNLTLDQFGLYSIQGKVGIPENSLPLLISQAHGIGHRSSKLTLAEMQKHFIAKNLRQHCSTFVKTCLTCLRANTLGTHKVHQNLPPPIAPFSHWQVDFTHIPKIGKLQEYLLVFTDHFSRWVEAFPCRHEDAKTVVKFLVNDIIPRFGCPQQINSDNGPAFVSKVLQLLISTLQITWKFHIPYHPQSAGVVERMNRTIKDKLTKATSATWTNWKSFLPAVLAEIRMTPHSVTKLSPFEIVMGRPFPTPWVKGPLVIQHTDLNLIQEEYVRNLITTLNGIYGDVSLSFPLPPQEPTHPFRPGDPVVVRQLHRYRKGGFPFGPRVTVIAITRTAVLTDASDHWIHASRVKLAPTLPTPELSKADNTEHDTTTKSVTEGPEDDVSGPHTPTTDDDEEVHKTCTMVHNWHFPFSIFPDYDNP